MTTFNHYKLCEDIPYAQRDDVEFNSIVGLTFSSIEIRNGDTEAIFHTADGQRIFLMYHQQFCCEGVSIDDIVGDLDYLLDVPILAADLVIESGDDSHESSTWSFYTVSTIKGTVVFRWFGSSNGYYSETVSFQEYREPIQ